MKKLIYVLALVLGVSGMSYASFPVKSVDQREAQELSIEKATLDESVTVVAQPELKGETNILSDLGNLYDAGAVDNELIITLLLWFFLGFFAAHRWYKQKPIGWNILFILTGGGCGVWALIDLINILTGKF